MDVVLANGDLKTIDANSDLWWGLKGAGHNFGIVTSVTTKIYDIVHPNWAIETIIFSGDKVAAVYEAANKYIVQNGKQSSDIINWSYWLNDASLDADKVRELMSRKLYISVHSLTLSLYLACYYHVHHPRRCQRCGY
jgi:FAD/FMN-containing dehydrogenase